MKKCTKCKEVKNLICFGVYKVSSKPIPECKECVRKRAREHFEKNREACNEKKREYYKKNKEKTLEKQKKYYQENRQEIRKKCNERNKTPKYRQEQNERARKYQKANKEKINSTIRRARERNPQRINATQHIFWALKLGILIKPEFCEKCEMKSKLQAHHDDYEKPLDVRWLCRICHNHEHGKLLDVDPKDKKEWLVPQIPP